jgi:hypothetical protein
MRLTRDRVLFVTAIVLGTWLVNRKPSIEESRAQAIPAYHPYNKYIMTSADTITGGFSNAVSYHYDDQSPRPSKAVY